VGQTTPTVSLSPPSGATAPARPQQPAAPLPAKEQATQERYALENQLVQVRLGIASSLFTALRMKHADTASHSLRVALSTSSWMLAVGMSDEQRDIMEVAALLHDVGKIGVPDSILLKPAALTADEVQIMDQHRRLGVEILRNSCASQAILDIVATCAAWYDGSNRRAPLGGDDIPLGARMLAICDAFDAMTSDQVYRQALSREAALAELFRFSGTQFDPKLVQLFADLQQRDMAQWHERAVRKWLQTLSPEHESLWRLNLAPAQRPDLIPEEKFQQRLLDNMRDGVVFVDTSLRILSWNAGAERMTGIAGSSVYQRPFRPALLNMHADDNRPVHDNDCPVKAAIYTGEMRLRRLVIRGRGQRDLMVELQVIPVAETDGSMYGAAVLLHDVSPEMSLEARCQSLHEAATKDPLTRVANRAEFNRVHQMFVAAHLERELPCSLIITDLDHFKKVNDTYGHQAGDDVLQAFASLLKSYCRPGDLVARYGGEEFVILCADCNNSVAARRAEMMRRAFSQMMHPSLADHSATASFGVTEIQAGDTPESMLKRADRALYEAKATGRNRVVQLGTGLKDGQSEAELCNDPSSKNLLVEQNLLSLVPLSLVVQKMRGFVADHQAKIISVSDCEVSLQFPGSGGFFRRQADRKAPLSIELRFSEESAKKEGDVTTGSSKTRIHARVLLQRTRDRRREDTVERARQLLASLRSYLMATEVIGPENEEDEKETEAEKK
jgi:diguanylate cyclase (GGDEF)-like protein/putative nucleotidyltransferase with HDIG domain